MSDLGKVSSSHLPTEELLAAQEGEDLLLKQAMLAKGQIAALHDNSTPGDPLNPSRVQAPIGDSTETKTSQAAASIFPPNVAYDMLKLGLQMEKSHTKSLHHEADKVADIQKTMEQLINLSGEFAVHAKGDDEKVLSDEILSMCQHLQEKGIEILQGNEGKISRERMAELKAHISARIDHLKTEVQGIVTTKMQPMINQLHSILECLKTIEKYANRLNSTIIANQRGG